MVADHPELADAIRLLQGRTYALERSEEKLALGLTKAELRCRETLHKKRAGLEEERAELDAQIAELDGELLGLGVERQRGFEAQHRQALEELLIVLGTHLGQVQAAGFEVTELLPDLQRWLPEIEQLAAQKTGPRRPGRCQELHDDQPRDELRHSRGRWSSREAWARRHQPAWGVGGDSFHA